MDEAGHRVNEIALRVYFALCGNRGRGIRAAQGRGDERRGTLAPVRDFDGPEVWKAFPQRPELFQGIATVYESLQALPEPFPLPRC